MKSPELYEEPSSPDLEPEKETIPSPERLSIRNDLQGFVALADYADYVNLSGTQIEFDDYMINHWIPEGRAVIFAEAYKKLHATHPDYVDTWTDLKTRKQVEVTIRELMKEAEEVAKSHPKAA